MITVDNLLNFNQEQVGLNITETTQENAWKIAQQKSSYHSRWQSYLNLMAKRVCFSWLSEISSGEVIEVEQEDLLLEIWEFVNGFVIRYGEKKLIFIPSESYDLGAINVPAEWVDIPGFVGDFYIPVQINPDEGWLRIWGYSSYECLKQRGEYEHFSRSYIVPEEELNNDVMFMLVSMQYEERKSYFAPELGFLSSQEATDLLARLKGFKDYELRLILPFQQWGLIFGNEQWRRELYETRKPINLTAWISYNFQQAMLAGWQTLESLNLSLGVSGNGVNGLNSNNGLAMRSSGINIDTIYHADNDYHRKQAIEAVGRIKRDTVEAQMAIAALTYVLNSCEDEETRWSAELSLRNLDPHNMALGSWRGKILDLGLNLTKYPLALVIGTLPKSATQTSIFVRVYPRDTDVLPENLTLTIFDEAGQEFQKIISRNLDNLLQYKFWGQPGEQFTIQLQLDEALITESFVI